MRAWVSCILLIVVAGACNWQPQPEAAQSRPNLLFILTDQQRRDTLGAYGNRRINTPNLDALAKKSVLFENAYVTQPICSPSRASLLTGLYPHSHGVTTNNIPLRPNTPILTEMLAPGRYKTGWYGKWHLGDEIFRQRGFDRFESTEDNYIRFYSDKGDRSQRSGYFNFLKAKGIDLDNQAYARGFANTLPKEFSKAAYVADRGVEFLDQHREHPFVLYLSFLDPHPPFNGVNENLYDPSDMEVPETFFEALDPTVLNRNHVMRSLMLKDETLRTYVGTPQDLQQVKAKYWGKVTLVDEMVGRVLNKLRELALEENTIIVFTSEHGELMGDHRLMHKQLMYEESVTVPLLLSYSRLKPPSQKVATPVTLADLVPTLLDLMNERAPAYLEGRSWAPALLSGENLPELDVFIEYNGPLRAVELGDWNTERVRTVVTPDGWKLTVNDQSQGELYNLKADAKERTNLFYREDELRRVQALVQRIQKWQRRTHDKPVEFDEAAWKSNRKRTNDQTR